MFGEDIDPHRLIDQLRSVAHTLRSPTSALTDELRALAQLRNAIDAAMSNRLSSLDETRGFEAEGASNTVSWARRELRMDASDTRHTLRAKRTATVLPSVGRAFGSGSLSARHVQMFTYALKHVGESETMAACQALVEFALTNEPSELGSLVRQVRDLTHPDDLDARWVAGMDRADLHLSKLMEGWHLTGFLPQEVGARLDALLRSWTVPISAQDNRTPADRRINNLDQLLERALADSLPTDGTIRPQIHVTVDAGSFRRALTPHDDTVLFEPLAPATLTGFGHIGPKLLRYLTCEAAIEPILIDKIDRNHHVLDVGRSQRLATAKQRTAIWHNQGGQCAAPGCRHSISHVHHVRWHSRGGPTNLDNLIGLCGQCHRLVHAEKLDVARRDNGTGWQFTNSRGHPIAA